MMSKVSFDYSKAKSFFSDDELKAMEAKVLAAKDTLVNKTGEGNDFLGWIDYQ